ncbi:hypothetical protein C2S52_018387 [Perilla frutescens var. hirtella]|nr:hypothetical protein C2S52_018387 [Perilla frutescens var. hirtella]KAH6812097.1 hypothetical protein C2S51_025859 [Perilla frutescens var. frutescens]
MEILVDLHFNFGGTWINNNGKLEYDGGDVDILSNFDLDYLCYVDIKERYVKHIGIAEIKNIYVLEPGKDLTGGLLLVDDDESIKKVLYHINQVSEEGGDEDCEDERDIVDSSVEECDLDDGRIRVSYNETDGLPHFILGMAFANAKEARFAISNYSVAKGVALKLKPNEPYRIRTKCKNEKGCPFMLFISKDGRNPGLVVKRLMNEHKCFREFKIPQASASFLANHYKEKIQRNPNYRVKDMKDDAEINLKLFVTYQKCKRAKKKIVEELNGSYKKEFGYLEAYCAALRKSNPGTKAEIELFPGKRFMRCDEFLPIEPPIVTKMTGRPRKK